MQMAQVVRVMIASPSDVPEARSAAYKALNDWNDANTRNRDFILLPLKWETSAIPSAGEDGQSVINRQLVDESDIVIAIFGARLGHQTARSLSGTAEEIQRAIDSNTPVHLYFSKEPLPSDVDLEELKKVREFRDQFPGLYGTFANAGELQMKVWQAIEHDIAGLTSAPMATTEEPKVDFLVQTGQQVIPHTDNRGRLKHTTKRWVELTNRGTADAEDVTVEAAPDTHVFISGGDPKTVQHGQMRKIPFEYALGTSNRSIIVRWTFGGEEFERQFDLD